MSSIDLLLLAVVVVMTLCVATLGIAETSITRTSRARASSLAKKYPKAGGRVLRIVDNLERDLNSIYLSLNIVQTVQSALVGVLAASLFGPLGVAVGILVNVLVLFIVAEAAPKTWALQNTERAALLTAPLVELVAKLLRYPARALIAAANLILPGTGPKTGPFVTEDEILAMASEAAHHSVIDESERALIHSIISFGDTVAREIMVPRTDMVMVADTATVSELIDVAIDKGRSRVPVFAKNADDISGVVYVKDAMRAERSGAAATLAELIRPAYFVPETIHVAYLLAQMQSSHNHLAIVVDEYGGTAGLATLEDLLEELVGEIHDEFDTDAALIDRLPTGDVIVNASMNVDDVNDALGLDLPEGSWDSIGGFVFTKLGRIPVPGDVVVAGVTQVIVEIVEGRRIKSVRLAAAAPGTVE